MRLADLVDTPKLGLRVLHAVDGDLAREFRWTYQTDLLEPGRYLAGGEVVLSGLQWRTGPADADVFVANLVAAGAVGLIAGDLVFDGVPDDLVDACRTHGLPLLGLSEQVSFLTVVEHVLGEARSERSERLAASLGRHRRLLTMLAEGRPLDDLIRTLERDAGVRPHVLTATGLTITDGEDGLAAEVLDAIVGQFLTATALPATCLVDGTAWSVFSVGPSLGDRSTGWLVVVEGDWNTWPITTTEAVGEFATVLQLERVRREEGRRSLDRVAADLFGLLASGGAAESEIALRLRQCGIDPEGVFAVVVAGFDEVEWQENEHALMADAVAHLGRSVVGSGPDGFTMAIVPAGEDGYVERLRRALHRLAPALTRTPLAVGVSEPTAIAGLSGMAEEARHALAVARLSPGSVRLTSGAEVTSHAVLLANVPPDVRSIFADRVLGAIVDYDAQHRAGLLETVRAFLDCDGSWTRAAAELHVHVNTVRYRLEKVEQLSGRDLSSLQDRIDLYLALQSR